MIVFLLVLHNIATVLLCALALSQPYMTAIACFIVVFSFWGVNYIAVELENPYGDDANDLPLREMQTDLNQSLISLLHPLANKPPFYDFNPEKDCKVELKNFDMDAYTLDLEQT